MIPLDEAARKTVLSAALALLAGCASVPAPQPLRTTPPLACPVCTVCQVCAAPSAPIAAPEPAPLIEPTPTVAEAPRGRLEKANWNALPTSGDDPRSALTAFRQSCEALKTRLEWLDVCLRAAALPAAARADAATAFFRENFDPYRVVNANETDTGLMTGYYEPLLRGARAPTSVYRYPIYAVPQDLVSVELTDVYQDLKFRRLRGRIIGNKLQPYLDRAAIESREAPLKGLELAWVDDPVELFFLHIQGSGQIQLPDGTRMRVGYADQNGHPFRSLGGLLIRRGELRPERASMQGIKEWAKRNPAKLAQYLNANPSYVFFKELPNDLSGPIGTLGVPLTAERSIAVDAQVIPLGVPVFVSTTFPNSPQPLNRLMVAQDTGGAIAGAVRADFYWGFGDDAGAQAGKMKQPGRMWVLLPRGYDPNAPAANGTTLQLAPALTTPGASTR